MQKQFTLFMFLGFIAFAALFLFVLFVLNPQEGAFAITTFFISLTFMIVCFGGFSSYHFRKKATNNEIYYSNVKISLRESFLLAAFVDIMLFLGIIRLLTWWDALLLAGCLILLEMYFLSPKSTNNHHNEERIL